MNITLNYSYWYKLKRHNNSEHSMILRIIVKLALGGEFEIVTIPVRRIW